jgi:hypothetical protein
MGIATVIMMIEKLPQIGQYLTKQLGIFLVASSVWVLLSGW